MSESLKNKTLKGFFWSALQKFSVQGIQFVVMLVIAKILGPRAFGLVGMLTIFISVSDAFINSGFSQALIRKQDRTDTDNCTVFYFNIVVAVVMYSILFVIAPTVSAFYKEPELTKLLRVIGLIVIIHSFAVVQRSIYTAAIDFKTLAKTSFTSAVVSGAVGLFMAYSGFGVWTLVGQQLTRAFVDAVLLWWYSTWRPKLVYSWQSFHSLFAFGSNLLLSGLLNALYGNIYQITIGKLFSAQSLGFFTQAKTIASLPSSNLNDIVGNVTYPVLSTIQNEDERLAVNYRKLLRMSAFVVFPLMCGLAAISNPLIDVFLGEEWHFTAILLIPICLNMMWYPVHAINLNLLKVKGRSDLFLRLEIIKKILGIMVLLVTTSFGVLVMCYGSIVSGLLALFINTYYTGKFIHVGFLRQMLDLSGVLVASLSMFALVYCLTLLFDNSFVQLIVGVLAGVAYFALVCLVFKFDEIDYIKSFMIKK